ncbi:MAG: hypothetical protein WDN69_33160 [Aliidongia sp.]
MTSSVWHGHGRPGASRRAQSARPAARGFDAAEIQAMRQGYNFLFGSEGTFAERVDAAAERYAEVKPMMEIIGFIRADSKRRMVQPDTGHGA